MWCLNGMIIRRKTEVKENLKGNQLLQFDFETPNLLAVLVLLNVSLIWVRLRLAGLGWGLPGIKWRRELYLERMEIRRGVI